LFEALGCIWPIQATTLYLYNLKQVWLECGGKSPNFVFADCQDLDLAARKAAFGIFFNQGEVCSGNSRLYV
jgi:gamma-glutamyl-gamma-aminobutyraldehyde dehydrogenase